MLGLALEVGGTGADDMIGGHNVVGGIDELAAAVGRPKMQLAKRELGHDFYREVEEKIYVPLSEAMRIRGKLENYDRVDEVLVRLLNERARCACEIGKLKKEQGIEIWEEACVEANQKNIELLKRPGR